MVCKEGAQHQPPVTLATYDKIGPPDNLDDVTFTEDWALQVSNFFEAILHPTSDWLKKLQTFRTDDKPFAAFIHFLDKEYLTCTHATLSDARDKLENKAKFVPTKLLLSKFFTDYDTLVKNFEHQKRRIPGGDEKYRYPWHAYYSVLLQAIQRGSQAYNQKIELQAMELRLKHGNVFPSGAAGEDLAAEFRSQLQTVDESFRADSALRLPKTALYAGHDFPSFPLQAEKKVAFYSDESERAPLRPQRETVYNSHGGGQSGSSQPQSETRQRHTGGTRGTGRAASDSATSTSAAVPRPRRYAANGRTYVLRPSGDSSMLTIVKSPEGSQYREWSPAAKDLTKDQRTVIAGGCMVSVKTTLPGGDVIYKQCGNGNVTPCDRHNQAAPAGFFASVHADHPVHPLSSCADVEEFNFFHADQPHPANHQGWESLIRFVAVVGILACLRAASGGLATVHKRQHRQSISLTSTLVPGTERS